jgi:hypothetical protein
MSACEGRENLLFYLYTSFGSFIIFNIRFTINIIPSIQEVKRYFFTRKKLIILNGYISIVFSQLSVSDFLKDDNPLSISPKKGRVFNLWIHLLK